MTNFIPKDRTGAYQPWKLTSLEGNTIKKAQDDPHTQTQQRAKEDAEKIKAIHHRAYREGYEAGYSKGASMASAEAVRLAELADSVSQAMSVLEHGVAEDLVRLSLTLARSLVRESLEVHPELVAAIVRESVRDVPPFGQGTRLRIHPEDAKLLQQHLAKELGAEWAIVEDPTLTRGGCKIESATGEIDATLETRWQKLCAALAQDHEWIA